MKPSIALFVLAAFGFAACQSGQDAVASKRKKAAPVPFYTLATGQYASAVESSVVVARDEARFDSLWQAAYESVEPRPERPAVDFTAEAVVAYFAGMKSSGGFSTEIKGVTQRKQTLFIETHLAKPGPDCLTVSVITSPFVFARVPLATDPEEVVLAHEESERPCSN